MIFEWDPAKRHANLDKHGIDFVDADLVFAAAFKMTIDVTRPKDEEARFADFAEVEEQVFKLVYTIRGAVGSLYLAPRGQLEGKEALL